MNLICNEESLSTVNIDRESGVIRVVDRSWKRFKNRSLKKDEILIHDGSKYFTSKLRDGEILPVGATTSSPPPDVVFVHLRDANEQKKIARQRVTTVARIVPSLVNGSNERLKFVIRVRTRIIKAALVTG